MHLPVTVTRSLIAVFILSPVALAQRFSVSTIPPPQGGTSLEAYSINQKGAVTGDVTIGSQSCIFLYAGGSLTPVCSLVNGQGGYANWINDSNQIAGSSDNHGFIYSHGTVADVGLLPQGTFSDLLSLNDLGNATGQADTGSAGNSHAIEYSFSTRKLTDLGTLPTGDQSYGLGINNAGDVTGYGTVTGNGGYDAFLYSSGKLNDIGKQPGWTASQGSAINRFAQVTGHFLQLQLRIPRIPL